jgi:hypothetical protein
MFQHCQRWGTGRACSLGNAPNENVHQGIAHIALIIDRFFTR